jgi:hypothetical protein
MPGAFFFGLSLTVFSSSSSEISLSLSSFHLISVSLGVLLSGVSVSGSSTGKYFRMRAIAVSFRVPAQFPLLSCMVLQTVLSLLLFEATILKARPQGSPGLFSKRVSRSDEIFASLIAFL